MAATLESTTAEADRITALKRYEILDTPPDGAFDRITALAARILKTPISIISLVDTDRIWFKSHHGLDIDQVNRGPGLCASAILADVPYLVTDAISDPRTLANPLVAGDLGLRYYVGVPLKTRDHFNLGVLCCLDRVPRQPSPSDIAALQDLAAIVMDEMELRLAARKVDELHRQLRAANAELSHQASHDAMTGLRNRRAMIELLEQAQTRARMQRHPVSILMLDVDHFKQINDTYGHPAGDAVLAEVARRLTLTLRDSDSLGRIGGEEFLAVLDSCSVDASRTIAERCCQAISGQPICIDTHTNRHVHVTISVGVAHTQVKDAASPNQLISTADEALYEAKRGGRNRVSTRIHRRREQDEQSD